MLFRYLYYCIWLIDRIILMLAFLIQCRTVDF